MRAIVPLTIVGFIAVGGLGYWLAGTATVKETRKAETSAARPKAPHELSGLPERAYRSHDRPAEAFRSDDDALEAGALPGQRNLVFSSKEALEAFLARAGKNIRVMGRIDALNALRVGFLNYADLAGLLDGTEDTSMIFPVTTPPSAVAGVQDDAVALGNRLLDWLGVTTDNSTWGHGVKIAILDTGVSAHPAFTANITSVNYVPLPADASAWNGHGTAVASTIIGNSSFTPGVSPAADILSFRIADDNGQSNSFLLAQAIVAAADAGAQLISISMSSYGDSALVRNALDYAYQLGAVVVAAAGNWGTDRVSYPAANKGVVSVAGVDAANNHLDFSNTGETIDISAPGYSVNAAWPDEKAIAATGTSFSTPIVTGSIAALMTNGPGAPLTVAEAVEVLLAHTTDIGAPGSDTATGKGAANLAAAMNSGTSGIYDAAVTSNWISTEGTVTTAQVVVQNLGTETLVNTGLEVAVGTTLVPFNITTLAPGATATFNVPISSSTDSTILSTVNLTGGQTDSRPANNTRADRYTPPQSQ